MIVLDSDHLSVFTDVRDSRSALLKKRLDAAGEGASSTIVSVEEVFRGWMAFIHRQREIERQMPAYARLAQFLDFLKSWQILPFGDSALDHFIQLRRSRIRIGSMDCKIASIVLANEARLLTANARDFGLVPGLRFENWLE